MPSNSTPAKLASISASSFDFVYSFFCLHYFSTHYIESHSFDNHRNALPHADAHGAQRVAAAAAMQLIGRGSHQARAAHAQWMAQRDGAAVGIDAGVIVAQAELAQHRQSLRGKGLIQFD